MAFPGAHKTMVGERGQKQQRKDHFINLFLIGLHGAEVSNSTAKCVNER